MDCFARLTGACFAGLYMVIESWLNDRIPNNQRGSFMAIYMILNLGSIAAAQQFLNIADPGGFELFILASVLVSLAVLPVVLTKSEAPVPIPTDRMWFSELYRSRLLEHWELSQPGLPMVLCGV